jgi:hypothetical protein
MLFSGTDMVTFPAMKLGSFPMKRAVLYLRVDQTTANQERELREIAGRIEQQMSADDAGRCCWQMLLAWADVAGLGRCCWQMLLAWADVAGLGRCCWPGQMLLAWADVAGLGRCCWPGQMLLADTTRVAAHDRSAAVVMQHFHSSTACWHHACLLQRERQGR